VSQSLACLRAGVLAVLDQRDAVHEDIGDAGGIMVRVYVGGVVLNLVGVEYYDIGPVAFAQLAPALEVERVRGQAGHLADGILQTQHVQLADVPGQDARVITVAARGGGPGRRALTGRGFGGTLPT